ncbi:hypothetical protein [Absidia glauca]|uniref:Nuclear fusion protein KAR5 n=1 Tax=Absidia glauca TaxID=4829 RepID=A0A163JHT2_ABSGL|nr:hypothetical protein [Absidia glauca]
MLQIHAEASNLDDLPFIYLLPVSVTQRTQTEGMTQQIANHGLDILHGIQSKQMDCFHKSTLSIEEDCQQLVSDEKSQMKYALMLTLCELATAQIQVPKECQLDKSMHHMKSCIKKLATVPQTWTTYSGYYRDVVTICFAVRYPLERELLRQAQQNMTVYQSQSYQKIQQQQQDLYEWRQQEMGLLKAIQLQQSDLWTEITDFQGRSAGNLLELMSLLQNAQNKATDIQSIQQTTMEIFLSLDQRLGSMYSKLDELSVWQNLSLTQWIQWQESQEQAIQQWQQSVNIVNHSISDILNHTEHQLNDLKGDILDIHTDLSTLLHPVRQVFALMMDSLYFGIRPFLWMGVVLLCWLLPTSLIFTALKTLALGYQIKTSFYWPSSLVSVIVVHDKTLDDISKAPLPGSFRPPQIWILISQ